MVEIVITAYLNTVKHAHVFKENTEDSEKQ